jgi:hypothetical protein
VKPIPDPKTALPNGQAQPVPQPAHAASAAPATPPMPRLD